MKINYPSGALCGLAFILLAENALGIIGPALVSNPISLVVRAKQSAANEHVKSPYDILIFGDSSAEFALAPKILSKLTNLKSFSFATMGEVAFVSNYYNLRDYLRHNSPPKAVVLMFSYDVWGLEARDDVTQLCVANYGVDYVRTLSNADAVGKVQSAKGVFNLLPSQKYRHDLQRLIWFASVDSQVGLRPKNKSYLRHVIRRDEGCYRRYLAHLSAKYRTTHEKDINADAAMIMGNTGGRSFRMQKTNEFYIKKFMELAIKSNIRVYVAYPPLWEEFYAQAKGTPYFMGVSQFISTLPNKFPNVTALNSDFYAVPDIKLLESVDHMTEQEAIRFTTKMAAAILNAGKA